MVRNSGFPWERNLSRNSYIYSCLLIEEEAIPEFTPKKCPGAHVEQAGEEALAKNPKAQVEEVEQFDAPEA